MQLITVAGPPSAGKTSVILNIIKAMQADGETVGVVKFDCLSTQDQKLYEKNGVVVKTGLSGNLCPDHFFVTNIQDCLEWGIRRKLDVLISESAGLCNRCSPHLRGVMAVCVIDNLSGVNTPRKIGPMLKFADVIIITKGDIVSQAEREVFAFRVKQANPGAMIVYVNGITGQGAPEVSRLFKTAAHWETLSGCSLRFSMPAAVCSYCLGQTRVGVDFQMGNVRKMDLL
ncbi:GTP-binding protein [Sporomusa sp.]|uniref:GTP-binding protein n=1 Tax=Sporomusa sp. TaxID=2078658 RepID=UPI002C95F5C7|nr:GTP-binding protein [Sporomusa sp.]HWR05704.1 GTP-binding protein [Sporomusa sp.]